MPQLCGRGGEEAYSDHMIPHGIQRQVFDAVQEIRVRGDLAKLHEEVEEADAGAVLHEELRSRGAAEVRSRCR